MGRFLAMTGRQRTAGAGVLRPHGADGIRNELSAGA